MSKDARVHAAVAVVARAEGVPARLLLRPRGGSARRARWMVFYLLCVVDGVARRRVARLFGVGHSTVIDALARVEDARDVPAIDERIAAMEDGYRDAIAT